MSFTPDARLALELPEGFVVPDYTAPIDVAARLDAVPTDATIKGVYFTDLRDEAERRGLHLDLRRRVLAFRDYPLRDFHEVMLEAAAMFFPDVPIRERLRRLGHLAYPAFERTLVGKVIFGALRHNVAGVMGLAPRGWQVSLSHAHARVVDSGDHHVRVRLSGIYSWLDCYDVAVFEGALMTLGRRGVVALKAQSLTEGDVYARWR